MNKKELTDIAHSINECKILISKITTAITEKKLTTKAINFNMQRLSNYLGEDISRLKAIADRLPDDNSEGGKV